MGVHDTCARRFVRLVRGTQHAMSPLLFNLPIFRPLLVSYNLQLDYYSGYTPFDCCFASWLRSSSMSRYKISSLQQQL